MSLELLAQISQIAGAVIFLVLAVVLWNKFLAPAVKSYTASKNAEIRESEERRERMRRDLAAAQAEVSTAEADAGEIRARIDVVANRERTQSLENAKAEAERIVRNAEGELNRARMSARDRLRIEFIEKALLKARAEAASRVDASTNARLVNATVDDLAKGKS